MGVALESLDAFATALGIPSSFLTLLGMPDSSVPDNMRGLHESLVGAVEELLNASDSDAFKGAKAEVVRKNGRKTAS